MIGTRLLFFRLVLPAVALASLAIVCMPMKASAHYPASSGTIDAELHIDPQDNPTPGVPQKIYFIFSDSSDSFSLKNCQCNLSIGIGNQLQFYGPLQPPSTQLSVYSTAGIPFTFNQGLYHFEITGQALAGEVFAPFDLSWNLQVNQPPAAGSDFSVSTFLSFFAAIAAVMLVIGLVVLAVD